MNKCTETLLAALMALGPTIIAVTMMHHYGPLGIACSLIFSGIYMLVLVLALTLRSCLRQRCQQSDEERLQSSDEEDSPPPYEVVTAKPPPYSLLFASVPPMGDVVSCSMPAGGGGGAAAATTGAAAPVHSLLPQEGRLLRKGVLHCYAWIVADSEASPPSYFEAIGAGETAPPSPAVGNSPPTGPPDGAAPRSPPDGGTAAPSCPAFGAAAAHAPANPGSSEAKCFPT